MVFFIFFSLIVTGGWPVRAEPAPPIFDSGCGDSGAVFSPVSSYTLDESPNGYGVSTIPELIEQNPIADVRFG
jgi:hypothetical protein